MNEEAAPVSGPDGPDSEQRVHGSGRRAAEDDALVDALAVGLGYAAAGRVVSVSERTVRRRMADPSFAASVARRRAQRLGEISGQLAGLSERAVAVLSEGLGDDDLAMRLRTAQLVLSMARQFRGDVDRDARLVAIEEALGLTGTASVGGSHELP